MPAVYASMFTAGNGPIYASMGEAAPEVAAGAPASVTLTATGGTTMLVSWVHGSGGAATAFDVELEASASGTWVTATGAANPTAGGATSFTATGLTVVTPYRARVRAKKSGFADSAYTTSATTLTDNVGTGGAVIGAVDGTAPTLTGSITITAGPTSTTYTAQCPPGSDAVGITGYQWRLGTSGAYTDIAGGGRSVSITGRTPASTDTLQMRCRDAAGNFSDPLTTAVTLLGIAPQVTTQPNPQSVVDGGTVTFTAAFSGTPTPTRQWFRNGAIIGGATGLSYSFTATLADTGAIFTCTATNSADSVTTNAVALTVTAAAVAPSIVTQPAAQTVASGSDVTFSVVASGTSPLAFQWRRNGVAIGGATGNSYTFTAVQGDSGSTFSVVVSNGVGSPATSANAPLTVVQASALVTWLDWAQELIMFLPDAPLPSIMFALQREAASYFRSTRAYRSDAAVVATTTAGLGEYVVTVPAGLELSGVPDAKVGDDHADEILIESGTPIYDVDATTPTVVGVASSNTIRVWPTPTLDDLEITASLCFTLTDDAPGVAEAIYLRHREPIKAMALDYMMSQLGKPWTNPQLAMDHRRTAQRGRLLHSTRAGPTSARTRLRSEPT